MSKHRVVVVGMDGCTQQILQPLIEQGKLPTLAKLQREGVAGKLWSVVPPITPAAWSSFYTGKLPGKHGVYEFLYRKPDGYEKAPVNSHSIRAKKWWEYANEAGLRTCLFNLPLLYPTKPVNGIAVSGMLTPDGARDFGKPEGTVEEIERAVGGPYAVAKNFVYKKGNAAQVLDELHRVLDYHMKAGLHLYRKERWDVFFCHLLQTDSMQHELWHLLDPTHSAHDPKEWKEHRERIEAIYTRIDKEFLAPMVESLDGDTTLLVMSDHGFGGIEHIIYMNLWLLQKGYIQWSGDWWTRAKSWMHRRGVTPRNMFKLLRAIGLGSVRDKMDLADREKWMNRGFMNLRRADWSKTRAYSMGNILGMIYLNVKGREPQGCVEPGEEYERLREQLMSELKAERIPNSNQPLFAKVEKGEDVFSGVYQQAGPDIVCTPTDWRYQVFGYQDFVSNKFIESYMEMTGHHRPDGILFGIGEKLAKGKWVEDCRLVDMGPTIMHLVGLPIPTDMDGTPLEQLFDDDAWEYPQMLPVEEATEAVPAVELSEDEQRLVMQRLKALGYEDGL